MPSNVMNGLWAVFAIVWIIVGILVIVGQVAIH